jgi:predicted SprT family Zn-dependent metalloprotease
MLISRHIFRYATTTELVECVLHEMIHAYLFQTGEQYLDDDPHGDVSIIYHL